MCSPSTEKAESGRSLGHFSKPSQTGQLHFQQVTLSPKIRRVTKEDIQIDICPLHSGAHIRRHNSKHICKHSFQHVRSSYIQLSTCHNL